MRVTEIETVLIGEFPNLVYVRVHTAEGTVGTGETFLNARAVAEWIHETGAPYLLGKNALEIDRHWQGLNPFVGFDSTGVDARGRAALDIALWDILGQVCGQPVHQLLGGASRDRIRVYNTCAGSRYMRGLPSSAGLPTDNWGTSNGSATEPYEDLRAFLTDAGALAESLLDDGVKGMKIWPFDGYAEKSGGQWISDDDLREGLEPFRRVREAVGHRIEVMAELHSLWNLPSALKIARALEPYEPAWVEDPLKMDDIDALAKFSAGTTIPTAASETLGSRWSFKRLLERGGVQIAIHDASWGGGISESKKVASMAEAYQLPFAPHDCTGPIQFAAALHLAINAPNATIQETCRAFYTSWYGELVTEVPRVVDGFAYPLTGPGLGTTLRPEVLVRPDVQRRSTSISDQELGVPRPSSLQAS